MTTVHISNDTWAKLVDLYHDSNDLGSDNMSPSEYKELVKEFLQIDGDNIVFTMDNYDPITPEEIAENQIKALNEF